MFAQEGFSPFRKTLFVSVTLITIAARTLLAFLTTVSVVMSMFNKLVSLKELQSSR